MQYVDWRQEPEFESMIENEKKNLMLKNQGLFHIYIRKASTSKIKTKWTKYFAIFSGFYLYLFENPKDKTPEQNIFLKGVDFTLVEDQEYKYVLRVLLLPKKFIYKFIN